MLLSRAVVLSRDNGNAFIRSFPAQFPPKYIRTLLNTRAKQPMTRFDDAASRPVERDGEVYHVARVTSRIVLQKRGTIPAAYGLPHLYTVVSIHRDALDLSRSRGATLRACIHTSVYVHTLRDRSLASISPFRNHLIGIRRATCQSSTSSFVSCSRGGVAKSAYSSQSTSMFFLESKLACIFTIEVAICCSLSNCVMRFFSSDFRQCYIFCVLFHLEINITITRAYCRDIYSTKSQNNFDTYSCKV